MFEDFLKTTKEKWEKNAKDILLEIEKESDRFWHELIEDLSRKKLGLENEIEKQEKVKQANSEEITKLSQEMIKLNTGIKTAQENLKKYEVKMNEMLAKITEIEAREIKSKDTENRLTIRENNLLKQEEDLRIEARIIEERQKSLKRIWDKAHS